MITKGKIFLHLGTLFTINTSIFFSFYLHDKYSINNKYDKYELSDILI
jgi:hypothetical protein